MGLADSIIKTIERAGWIVDQRAVNGIVEMIAIPLGGYRRPQTVRCDDGPNAEHRCACLLAAAVGIKLEEK